MPNSEKFFRRRLSTTSNKPKNGKNLKKIKHFLTFVLTSLNFSQKISILKLEKSNNLIWYYINLSEDHILKLSFGVLLKPNIDAKFGSRNTLKKLGIANSNALLATPQEKNALNNDMNWIEGIYLLSLMSPIFIKKLY